MWLCRGTTWTTCIAGSFEVVCEIQRRQIHQGFSQFGRSSTACIRPAKPDVRTDDQDDQDGEYDSARICFLYFQVIRMSVKSVHSFNSFNSLNSLKSLNSFNSFNSLNTFNFSNSVNSVNAHPHLRQSDWVPLHNIPLGRPLVRRSLPENCNQLLVFKL